MYREETRAQPAITGRITVKMISFGASVTTGMPNWKAKESLNLPYSTKLTYLVHGSDPPGTSQLSALFLFLNQSFKCFETVEDGGRKGN
jgi:hypothetical protein